MNRIPQRAWLLGLGAGSALLLTYSIGSLVLDDLEISGRHLASISLVSAGLIALMILAIDHAAATRMIPSQDRRATLTESFMHRITTADIIISVGRGLILAAAIIGATYYIGSWYFGGADTEALYPGIDGSPQVMHASAPDASNEATP